jgi:heme oxygenase
VKPAPAIDADEAPDSSAVREPTLRDLLRSTTRAVHERLHGHGGLAAVQDGTIERAAYTALLSRLYGFYRPFELAARISPERTRWLESDLSVFSIDAHRRLALACCGSFPQSASPEYILGALYVVEGSALGALGLARGLDGLLGAGAISGRRFFSGHGAETGARWRGYLDRLAAAPNTKAVRGGDRRRDRDLCAFRAVARGMGQTE